MHRPIGSSGLYSSALIYLLQKTYLHQQIVPIVEQKQKENGKWYVSFLKSIPARDYVDKCGPSVTVCSVYPTVLDKARPWQRWYFFVREIIIVCQCFQIATWCDTDETGTADLKACMEVDPAPPETLKKMNEDCDDEQSPILSMCN